MPFRYASPIDRLIANSTLDPATGCWVWIGKRITNRSGRFYGALSVRDTRPGRRGKVRTVFAHRFAVAAADEVPLYRVKVSMHRCDNTLCCNPDHLRRGTQRANILDAIKKGRR